MKLLISCFVTFLGAAIYAQQCRIFIDIGDCSEYDADRSYLYKDSTAQFFLDYDCVEGDIDSIVFIANGEILSEAADSESWIIKPKQSGSINCEAILFQNGEQHVISQEFQVIIPPLLKIRISQSESNHCLIMVDLLDRTGTVITSKFTTCFCDYSIYYKNGSVEDMGGSNSITIPEDKLDQIREIKVNGILVLSKKYNRTQWIVKGETIIKPAVPTLLPAP